MKQKVLSVLLLCVLLIGSAYGQNREVTGTVTSASDGTPMSGVSVRVVGATVATQTGGDGSYSISAPANGALSFSYIGYATAERQINNQSVINLELVATENVLDELVVIGYGTQSKREITGSIASIDGENFTNNTSASLDRNLQGLAAGVQASNTSGVLGQPAKIRIRGVSSISSSSDPLYVVDGIPYITGDQSGVFYNNPLSSINQNDIASVEVLKDGAATAIYGSRAAGGVILITTKSGRQGAPTVNYSNWFAFASPSGKHDLLNAEQFVELTNEKLHNAGYEDDYAFPTLNPDNQQPYDTDWQDIVFRNAFQQNHSLSLSGANENTNYYFSAGIADLQGVSLGNSQRKYNIRGKVDQKTLNDRVTIGLNTMVSYVDDRGFNESGTALSGNTASSLYALPNVPVQWPDGSYNFSDDGASLGPGANLVGIDGSYTNPAYTLRNNIYKTTGLHFNGSAYAQIELLEGLNFRSQYGAQYIAGEDYLYWNPIHGDGRSVNGRIYQYYLPRFRYNWQNYFTYNVDLGESNLNVVAGMEAEKSKSRYFFAHGYDLSSIYFAQHENIIGGSLNSQLLGGSASERAFQSFFGRVNYSLFGRYFISASLRHDKISSLPHGNQGATLPGISAGWDVAKEDFFSSDFVSQFKIRGGYATVGNTEFGNYPYAGIFSGGIYGDYSGIYYSQTGNDKLKFETSKKINIGVDLAFMNDRVTFVADYFRNNIDNMILNVPTPPSLGVPGNSIAQNIGSMYNQGFEFTLGGNVISNEDFRWQTNLNATFVQNKVLELVDGNDITYPYHILRENESIGAFYGYQYNGVNAANGFALYEKNDGSIVQAVVDPNGGSYYALYNAGNPEDVSEESNLGAEDKRLMGNSMPTWYGGFNNTFFYKGFDFSLNLTFSGGNKVFNRTRQEALNSQDFTNAGTELLDRWTTPGQQTDVPILFFREGNLTNLDGALNSRFLESGNFLRVKTIGAGYTFENTPWLSSIYLKDLRLFASLENAWVFTKYSGLDPEVANSFTTNTQASLDYFANPVPRTFTFGLNVNF